MGLTPAYVAILQQQWMRDDLSTIIDKARAASSMISVLTCMSSRGVCLFRARRP